MPNLGWINASFELCKSKVKGYYGWSHNLITTWLLAMEQKQNE
jgi:hypothetical protein